MYRVTIPLLDCRALWILMHANGIDTADQFNVIATSLLIEHRNAPHTVHLIIFTVDHEKCVK